MFGMRHTDRSMKNSCDKSTCHVDCTDKTYNIVLEFRRLYEEKMRIIDTEASGDCSLQAKLSLQQDWIRDLNEQNDMLVRAVEELEQEATDRVVALEERLRQSSKCACEVMNGYKDLSNAFQHMEALQEDVVTLLEFIRQSATNQTLDVSNLRLNTVETDNFINEIKKQHHKNKEKLQDQLARKDEDIRNLRDKLECAIKCKDMLAADLHKDKCEELRQSMMDMRDALTAEVADKHDAILTLKRDVQILEEQCRKADQQTHFKDDIIKELRKQIKQMKLENGGCTCISSGVATIRTMTQNIETARKVTSEGLILKLRNACDSTERKFNCTLISKYTNPNCTRNQRYYTPPCCTTRYRSHSPPSLCNDTNDLRSRIAPTHHPGVLKMHGYTDRYDDNTTNYNFKHPMERINGEDSVYESYAPSANSSQRRGRTSVDYHENIGRPRDNFQDRKRQMEHDGSNRKRLADTLNYVKAFESSRQRDMITSSPYRNQHQDSNRLSYAESGHNYLQEENISGNRMKTNRALFEPDNNRNLNESYHSDDEDLISRRNHTPLLKSKPRSRSRGRDKMHDSHRLDNEDSSHMYFQEENTSRNRMTPNRSAFERDNTFRISESYHSDEDGYISGRNNISCSKKRPVSRSRGRCQKPVREKCINTEPSRHRSCAMTSKATSYDCNSGPKENKSCMTKTSEFLLKKPEKGCETRSIQTDMNYYNFNNDNTCNNNNLKNHNIWNNDTCNRNNNINNYNNQNINSCNRNDTTCNNNNNNDYSNFYNNTKSCDYPNRLNVKKSQSCHSKLNQYTTNTEPYRYQHPGNLIHDQMDRLSNRPRRTSHVSINDGYLCKRGSQHEVELNAVKYGDLTKTQSYRSNAVRYPEYVRDRSPEYIRDRSPEYVRDKSPEYLRDRAPELLRDRGPDYLRERAPDSFRDRGPAYLRERSPEYLRERGPESVREQKKTCQKMESFTVVHDNLNSGCQDTCEAVNKRNECSTKTKLYDIETQIIVDEPIINKTEYSAIETCEQHYEEPEIPDCCTAPERRRTHKRTRSKRKIHRVPSLDDIITINSSKCSRKQVPVTCQDEKLHKMVQTGGRCGAYNVSMVNLKQIVGDQPRHYIATKLPRGKKDAGCNCDKPGGAPITTLNIDTITKDADYMNVKAAINITDKFCSTECDSHIAHVKKKKKQKDACNCTASRDCLDPNKKTKCKGSCASAQTVKPYYCCAPKKKRNKFEKVTECCDEDDGVRTVRSSIMEQIIKSSVPITSSSESDVESSSSDSEPDCCKTPIQRREDARKRKRKRGKRYYNDSDSDSEEESLKTSAHVYTMEQSVGNPFLYKDKFCPGTSVGSIEMKQKKNHSSRDNSSGTLDDYVIVNFDPRKGNFFIEQANLSPVNLHNETWKKRRRSKSSKKMKKTTRKSRKLQKIATFSISKTQELEIAPQILPSNKEDSENSQGSVLNIGGILQQLNAEELSILMRNSVNTNYIRLLVEAIGKTDLSTNSDQFQPGGIDRTENIHPDISRAPTPCNCSSTTTLVNNHIFDEEIKQEIITRINWLEVAKMFPNNDKNSKDTAEERYLSKIRQIECENELLRDAITKATSQLEHLDDAIAVYSCGNQDLENACQESNRIICRLEAEKLNLEVQLAEAQIQSSQKIASLEFLLSQYSANHDLQESYNDTLQQNYSLEREKKELQNRLAEFKIQSAAKIEALENTLMQYQGKAFSNEQQQTEDNETTDICCETDKVDTKCVCFNVDDSKTSVEVKCQTNIVCFADTCTKSDSNSFCNCKTDGVPSLKAEELKLEEVVHELQCSVSKILVSECQIKQDKARIAQLENQLSSAWRTKDSEVEAARSCREQEIANLKQLIDTLVNNLDNEKQRSKNLQKAIDSYHDTIDAIKQSEHQFKAEVLSQKLTIQNLQDALVQTKQNLQELHQKTNIECKQHTALVERLIMIVTYTEEEIRIYMERCDAFAKIIENLRDENLELQETLFYNNQDLDIYEMRLAKYQKLYNDVDAQCNVLKRELQSLHAQKIEKDTFVQDLSDNLSECQQELKQLFGVLNEEKLDKMDQSEEINELQSQLKIVSEKLNNALTNFEQEMEKNAKLSQSLLKTQNVAATIKKEALLSHEKLQAAAVKIANDEQKIATFVEQINGYQCIINELQSDQNKLKQRLAVAELQLADRCVECTKFNEKIIKLQKRHEEELNQFKNTICNLKDKLEQIENHCENQCQKLDSAKHTMQDLVLNECKVRQDLIDKETKFHTQINQYQSEQERLIMVVTSLENQIAHMNSQLNEKNHIIETLKLNIAGQECREIREKQDEIIRLKNEINSLIQTQAILTSENEKLQMQVSHIRSTLESNDEKHKIIISELEACLNDLQNDKDFILRKNEQLIAQLQSLQDVCNTKAETLINLEMELNETKCTRDSLCNESRQVIEHVKCWLEEQRKINLELHQRIKHKNDIIIKLNKEKKNLSARLKQLSSDNSSGGKTTVTQKTTSTVCTCSKSQPYSLQMIHSPPPQQTYWSMGSVDSTPCSIIDDSDWEGANSEDQCPQVWIQRVETLTEELQRSNKYWKTKMSDQDYAVSRDK